MQTLTIKAGQKDWRPRDRFRMFRNFRTVAISCTPTLSMQFDYGSDQDWKDWKKIAGVSFCSLRWWLNMFRRNRDAIHLGWRWNQEIRKHEFCIYANDNFYNKPYQRADQVVRIDAGETARLIIEKSRTTEYNCFLLSPGQSLGDVNRIAINPRFMPDWFTLSGAWYGGANNAPGPYGGKAPKYMEMKREIIVQ